MINASTSLVIITSGSALFYFIHIITVDHNSIVLSMQDLS